MGRELEAVGVAVDLVFDSVGSQPAPAGVVAVALLSRPEDLRVRQQRQAVAVVVRGRVLGRQLDLEREVHPASEVGGYLNRAVGDRRELGDGVVRAPFGAVRHLDVAEPVRQVIGLPLRGSLIARELHPQRGGRVGPVHHQRADAVEPRRPVPEHVAADAVYRQPVVGDGAAVPHFGRGGHARRAGEVRLVAVRRSEDRGVPLKKLLLKLGAVLRVHVARAASIALAQPGRQTDRLPAGGQRLHQPDRAQREMCHADQPAGEEEVVEVLRVQAPVGQAPQRRDGVEHDVDLGHPLAGWVVEVHRIAAVADGVFEVPGFLDILLGEQVVAQESPALSLAGLGADPDQLPVPRFFDVRLVLDVVPRAVELV